MRIIAGRFKGQRLAAPFNQITRPTTDRARETIFNILSHGLDIEFDGITVLDLYSGTGAFGFESMSRGAKRIIFVDSEISAINCIKSNGRRIKQPPIFTMYQRDASSLPARTHRDEPADLVFLDPPYRKDLITPTLIALDKGDWLKVGAMVVAEMANKDHYNLTSSFSLNSERRYGNTKIAFISYRVRSKLHLT